MTDSGETGWLVDLAGFGAACRYRCGCLIESLDEFSAGAVIVERGHARLYRHAVRGKEVTFGLLAPGGVITPHACGAGAWPGALLGAVGESTTVRWLSEGDLGRLSALAPSTARQLAAAAAATRDRLLVALEMQLEAIETAPVDARIARALLILCGEPSSSTSVCVSRHVLASLAATSDAEAVRRLRRLTASGLIEPPSHRRTVEVSELEKLRKFVHQYFENLS